MAGPTRRRFLAGLGTGLGASGLAGCLGTRLPGTAPEPDHTVFVGAYHWGFVMLDADGTERERIEFEPGSRVLLVAFNTEADDAIERLPAPVRGALPGHEVLEERNAERVPPPPTGTMHEALEAANDRYPDHSLSVMPAGYARPRMPMRGGMLLHPIGLPHAARAPTTAGLLATDRGEYTLTCQVYCGYGHPYMVLPGALVVG